MKEIEVLAGESLSSVVHTLEEAKKRGESVYCVFNDHVLFSDNISMDSAYMTIFGHPYNEDARKEHRDKTLIEAEKVVIQAIKKKEELYPDKTVAQQIVYAIGDAFYIAFSVATLIGFPACMAIQFNNQAITIATTILSTLMSNTFIRDWIDNIRKRYNWKKLSRILNEINVTLEQINHNQDYLEAIQKRKKLIALSDEIKKMHNIPNDFSKDIEEATQEVIDIDTFDL